MDSLEEEAPSIMIGGQRMESPRPMPRKDEGGERRSRDDDDNILVDKVCSTCLLYTAGPRVGVAVHQKADAQPLPAPFLFRNAAHKRRD